ncbi:hypothetical protein EDD17DRAFT_1756373 [Pisolithus thermaeus]|nr:hypothetical protein EV401DRAFT_2081179 [Pisolithus croceorrhizus]KAI6163394.1 hypothetical protein EDD17DRAFT_1756373 [Pisolithus thermaeus]
MVPVVLSTTSISTALMRATLPGSPNQHLFVTDIFWQQEAIKPKADQVYEGKASPQHSTSGQARWEEPDLPEIPKPHGLFMLSFSQANFFVNVTSPEHKKTYLLNWLAAQPLWISQVDVFPPSKFLSPQMWRDFLNMISMSIKQPSSTHSAASKSVVHNILGDDIVHLAQGMVGALEAITWHGMEVQVALLSDPPLQFMHSPLWELYELNFHYELLVLDQVLVAHLWISDESQITCQTLLYSIFPSESGLIMWSEPLPQGLQQLGMCDSDMQVALPFLNNFCKLLSTWPGAPTHLHTPAELDGQGNALVYEYFVLACQFYIQTAYTHLGHQPSLPHLFTFI